MIDRKKEQATFKFLGKELHKFCGSFRKDVWSNGLRVSGVELDDLSHPKTSALIARALARLHSLTLPDSLRKSYSKGSGLWIKSDRGSLRRKAEMSIPRRCPPTKRMF